MADRLKVFVSSCMKPLRDERTRVKSVLEADGRIEAWVYEDDVEARDQTIQQTYLERLEQADGYIGIFWKKYGAYTIDEYDHAVQFGKHKMVFIKKVDDEADRDPQLGTFLEKIGKPESGVTTGWFGSLDDLADGVKGAIDQWVVDAVRRRSANKPPELLVDRCNRGGQHIAITEVTQRATGADTQHHVVCVIDGHAEEKHRKFVEVLERWTIPEAIDPGNTPVKYKPVDWPDAKDYPGFEKSLLYGLSGRFLGRRVFDAKPIAEAIDRHLGPVMIGTVVPLADLAPDPDRFFEYFVRFWRTWPARSQNRLLFAFLCVQYHDKGKGGLLRFFRKSLTPAAVKAAATAVAEKTRPGGELDGVSFYLIEPELGPVAQKEAAEWADLDEVAKFVGGADAVSRVHARISKMFTERSLLVETDRIRMRMLTGRLDSILREVRRQEV